MKIIRISYSHSASGGGGMGRPKKLEENQRRAPSQARSKATVEAILEAAARIIRREGEAALTTNRIAEVAGVGVGSLYGYFPDKAAIQLALARRMLAEGDAAVLATLEGERGVAAMRALVRAVLELHATDKALRRSVMGVHLSRGGRVEHAQSTHDTVAEIARKFDAQGLTVDPLKLFIVTRAVLGVARSLVEEPDGAAPDPAVLEEELMALVVPYVASVVAAAP
jgi:AcrR family transcriptional regulator